MMTTAPLAGRVSREARSSPALVDLLDLLGRRGSLRLVWELRDGHGQSFRLLRSSADGISPSVLNARLKELREAQLVTLTEGGYRLTPPGQELVRHLQPLGRWARAWGRARISPADH
jgi:DNA-binding HxlR family transcriptional regulator